ncbi:MAG: CPBP family intramembrane glutamic endopeptidase [Polyangiaceae bacterium]
MSDSSPEVRRALAIVAPVVIVVGAMTTFAFDVVRAGTAAFAGTLLGVYVALAAFALAFARREGVLADWLRPVWGDISRGVLSAIALLFAAWAFVRVALPDASPRVSWIARIYLQFGSPGFIRAHLFLFGVYVVVVAACEEIVWRGLVLHVLEDAFGTRKAEVLSTLLFVVGLLPTAWALRDPLAGQNPLLPVAALGCGAVWTALRSLSGRLVPAILSHAMFAWCVLVTFRLWGPSV